MSPTQENGGISFELTSEQRMVQASTAEFTDREIIPRITELDQSHTLDMGIVRGMAGQGMLGAAIPEEYGGQGLDFVSTALICEEIERGDGGFRTLLSVHLGLNSLTLLAFGSEEQKEKYLLPQAKGEKIACFGLTEPNAGSDVAAMESTARRDGDRYILNGQKEWISYANVADHFLVFAKTDRQAGHRGISAFLLDRSMPGIETRDIEHKLGVWAGSTGEIFLSDVEVPAENRLGAEGEGFKIAMYALDMGRFTVAAGALGTIRAALDASVRYAQRARHLRAAHRALPVRAGHDRGDGEGIRDLPTAGAAGGLAQGQGSAQHPRDLPGEVARHRDARSRPPTWRCRYTAPTATPRSTRWRGSSAMPARRCSTRAPPRSTR